MGRNGRPAQVRVLCLNEQLLAKIFKPITEGNETSGAGGDRREGGRGEAKLDRLLEKNWRWEERRGKDLDKEGKGRREANMEKGSKDF